MTIINHSYEFIFVHIPKTAGTSITNAMGEFTSYCDLEIGGTGFGESIQTAYQRRFGIAKHSTAAEIQQVVGQVTWRKFFTFAFVRNPFARAVSVFNFLRTWEHLPEASQVIRSFSSFEDFVLSDYWMETEEGPDRMFRPQWLWLRSTRDYNDQLVEFVGKVESIKQDMAVIYQTLGIRPPVAGGRRRKRGLRRLNRSAGAVPADLYNDHVIERLLDRYGVDFDRLGYSTNPARVVDWEPGEEALQSASQVAEPESTEADPPEQEAIRLKLVSGG